ncbi:MAG TPA: IMP dehydrogenase [Acidobacteriota bacterium]|nr:IMP dehydrogenase [Acidobacteriota bacterium]
MDRRFDREALTFEDVLLVPAKSDVLPKDVDVSTRLGGILLPIPILSAAMDTVTDSKLAIALARLGGLGTIHRNMPIDRQAAEVDRVKRSESGMIHDPITLGPDHPVHDAVEMMRRYSISGIPITENGRLVGILTNRDLRFCKDLSVSVRQVMTKQPLITAPEGTTLDTAQELLHENRIEKLLIVDEAGNLRGMITVKDIMKSRQYPRACKDNRGRLRVLAAVGVGAEEGLARGRALVEAGVDGLCVDTSHGHTRSVMETTERLKGEFPDVLIMAGNVVTQDGTRDLIAAGADVIKVGIGPGSICTTRVVTGAGYPQLSAILNCCEAAAKTGTAIVADGGIRYSGDISKALAAGANAVMIGSLFAGTEEAPGEKVLFEGRSFKVYRGMGSLGAMADGARDRYYQADEELSKLVPEGIEGRVAYKGELAESIHQLIGGLRAGMGMCGTPDLTTFSRQARFTRVTSSGLVESHPHDVAIAKEAPNYPRG